MIQDPVFLTLPLLMKLQEYKEKWKKSLLLAWQLRKLKLLPFLKGSLSEAQHSTATTEAEVLQEERPEGKQDSKAFLSPTAKRKSSMDFTDLIRVLSSILPHYFTLSSELLVLPQSSS